MHPLLEFSLYLIEIALQPFTWKTSHLTPESRITHAQQHLDEWFIRKDYMALHQDISLTTAIRDLKWAVENGFLITNKVKNQTMYRFQPR